MVDLSKRASGILMHISSLPGETGIGTMGEFAYKFADILSSAGQTYWQILPLGPTGYGNSPYQSFSTFAGNPYLIDLRLLCKDGLITERDFERVKWCEEECRVDYGLLYKNRKPIFEKIKINFLKNMPDDFKQFCFEESYWLDDYSAFMAAKEIYGGKSLFLWRDEKLRTRDKDTLDRFKKENEDNIMFYKIQQYLFFRQWNRLKNYANSIGIYIIGDIPFYVSSDSADVWQNREIFETDEKYRVLKVAGCPPDSFSPEGQLWGNVLYNWNRDNDRIYNWWIKRLSYSFRLYDVLRIDHFRAFESYYSIDSKEKTAKNGKWVKGPDMDFWDKAKEELGSIPIIAEDLGFKTDNVRTLLDRCGFPGMKVLQFAFDSDGTNEYLPHNHTKNSVVYTGTHDNDTVIGWILNSSSEEIKKAKSYFRVRSTTGLSKEMIFSALSGVSNTCILTMQDIIGLDSSGRMNTPSTTEGNWQWRATHEQIKNADFKNLLRYTKLYARV